VIQSEAFKQALTLNGQDVAALYLKVLEQLGDGSYMRYRTVPVFPQVGDKINRAIEAIATRQMAPADALKQAQAQAVEAIRMGGYKIDG
jgi:multiple sugar transport system substrate-binding protein